MGSSETKKPETNKVAATPVEKKAAPKTPKLREVSVNSKRVRELLQLTEEKIFLVEKLSGNTEVKIKQGDKEYVVGKEVIS